MVDVESLRSWLRPEHLEPESIRAYRQRFVSHPGRLVLLEDLLLAEAAEKLTGFLRDDAAYEVQFGLYSRDRVPEKEWLDAEEGDRFFRFGQLAGTHPGRQLSPNMISYLQFRQALQSEPFKGYFEEITGLPLATSSDDIGVHAFRAGDFLRKHDDDNKNRSVALVLYLSPGWEPAFGGNLHVLTSDGEDFTIQPKYNSVVVFDVAADTSHYVEPVHDAAGERARFTIGGWYHRP